MIKKKKIIKVPVGKVAQIAEDHNCTEVAVYNALAYRSDSQAAQKIRKDALEIYGGIITTKVTLVEN